MTVRRRSTGRHHVSTGPRIILTAWALVVGCGLAIPAPAAGAPPADTRPVPLDVDDPNGAWAGYSLGESDTERASVPDGSVAGMDVSGHQGQVDWQRAWSDGARFAYIKATEGTEFRNDEFDGQYQGALDAGLTRGAYHFALPDRSPAAEQAKVFVDKGGGWAADGRTLPGALDIEYNPYGERCYGLDPEAMSAWIGEFSDTYRSLTGRLPAIYTTTQWWQQCTGDSQRFTDNPLWIARHSSEIGPLPGGWQTHTIWQFDTTGVLPGDQNAFNGDQNQLAEFAG